MIEWEVRTGGADSGRKGLLSGRDQADFRDLNAALASDAVARLAVPQEAQESSSGGPRAGAGLGAVAGMPRCLKIRGMAAGSVTGPMI